MLSIFGAIDPNAVHNIWKKIRQKEAFRIRNTADKYNLEIVSGSCLIGFCTADNYSRDKLLLVPKPFDLKLQCFVNTTVLMVS
jgi:hypothetical protein